MLLLLSALLLLLTTFLITAALPMSGRIGQGLAVISVFLGQIVLITEVLSELHAITPPAFLVAQIGLLGLAFALWNWQGQPPLFAAWRGHDWKLPLYLSVFLILVLMICLANLILTTQTLSFAGDGFYYHLPRSYFWMQHETAQPFFTHTVIMNEYPPNPSYYWLWAMLMRDSVDPHGLPIFQWIAGFWAVLGIAGWVRLAGYERNAAIFAGALTLTFPVSIIQMGAVETDLLTAGAGFAYVYFALASLRNIPVRQNSAILYTGLAFGLFLGSKVTAFFMLPGIGIAVLIYGWVKLRQQLWRPLLALVISGIIGFLLFGSYVYLWNLREFGHPIASRPISATTTGVDPNNPEYFSWKGNLARYSYQVMDWSLLPGEESFIARYFVEMYQQLDHTLDLDMEGVSQFRFDRFNQPRRSTVQLGYGIIGYMILMVAPFSLIYLIWRSRHDQRALFASLLILIGLSWLLIFSAMAPYDIYKMRHFPLVLAPLIAGLAPWLYHPRLFWLVGVIALLTAFDTMLLGFDRPAIANQERDHQFETNILANLLPAESEIGFANSGLIYFVIGELPQFDFEIVPSDVDSALQHGDVDVVLVYREGGATNCRRDLASYVLYLSRMGFCVHTADKEAFQQKFDQTYGYNAAGEAVQPHHLVDFRAEFLRVHLPLLPGEPMDIAARLTYRADILPDTIRSVHCNGWETPFTPRRGGLEIYLPQDQLIPDIPFQDCDIYFVDEVDLAAWGRQPDIAIQVQADQPILENPVSPVALDEIVAFSGFALPGGYEFDKCDRLPLITWWQLLALPEHEYKITAVLVPQQGEHFSSEDQVLIGLDDRPGEVFPFRHAIPLPCDLPGGLYDVQIAVYDPATLQKYAAGDGRDQIHLTTIFVR